MKISFFNIRIAIVLFSAFWGVIIFLLTIVAIDENWGSAIFVKIFKRGILQTWIIWMLGFYMLAFAISNTQQKKK